MLVHPFPTRRSSDLGSRVLLSIIEESDADRAAILDGIFTGTRAELAEKVARAEDAAGRARAERVLRDRKSTRLNSSHLVISYAVFCLKKKTKTTIS